MKLSPASWDLVPQILEILKTNFPHSKSSYNRLKGHHYLLKKFQKPHTILLTPDGQVDKYGTFLYIIPEHRYELQVDTLCPDLNSLAGAIASCEHIDWTKSPTFSSVHVRLFPLMDFLQERLPHNCRLECPVISFHMVQEQAIKLEIKVPDDIKLEALGKEHAEIINNDWPHGKTAESIIEVTDYIAYRPSVGLFKKDTNELVAWCLYGEYGGPAILQVKDGHKRKGYGEIALRYLTVRSAELGIDPHAYILPHNNASMDLFKKLGYIEKYPASWVTFEYKPISAINR